MIVCARSTCYIVNLRNVHSALRPQAAFGGMRMPSPAVGGGHRGVTYETLESAAVGGELTICSQLGRVRWKSAWAVILTPDM